LGWVDTIVNIKIFVITVLIVLGYVALVIISGQKVSALNDELIAERYNRLVAEEKLEGVLSKLRSFEVSLSEAHNQLETIQANLQEKERTTAYLQTEVEKVTKVKEILEQQLKNALVPTPGDGPHNE